jgi:membrane protease YdiL (CAAX protease family)
VANYPWLTPDPGVGSQLVIGALVAASIGLAVHSARSYPALVAARERGDHDAVRRRYRIAVLVQGARCLAVLGVLAADPGLDRADVGLRLPHGPHAGAAYGWTVYALIVLAAATVLLRVRARRGRSVPGQKAFAALVARDGERWAATWVAIGAGVSEELMFRGAFTAAAVGVFGLGPVAAVLAVAGLFGALHAYLGWRGVAGSAVAGVLLGALYLMSGSVLLPAVVHAAIDLRGLVLVPVGGPVSAGRGRPAGRRRRVPGPAGRGPRGTHRG